MKKLYLLLLLSLPIVVFGQYWTSEKQAERVWYGDDFGIYPNKNICYSDIIQKLVDSAYTLKGLTILKIPPGNYYFRTVTKIDSKRSYPYFLLSFRRVPNDIYHIKIYSDTAQGLISWVDSANLRVRVDKGFKFNESDTTKYYVPSPYRVWIDSKSVISFIKSQ